MKNSLLIFSYLLLLFAPAFINSGPLLQTDQPFWTAATHLVKHEVFPGQHWFWGVLFEQAGAGQKMGSTYSMSLILPWLFSFVFSAATSVKLAMFFSTLLFIVSFYLVARIYMPSLYALLSAAVIITPMFDNIVAGMWYNYFSLGCGLLFWLSCHHFFHNRSRTAYFGGVLSFALCIYAHPVGIMLSAAVLFAYLVFILISREPAAFRLLLAYASMPIIGVLLAFPQVQTILGLDAPPAYPAMESAAGYPVTGIVETLRRMLLIRVWGGIEPPAWDIVLMAANITTVLLAGSVGFLFLLRGREMEKILPLLSIILLTAILISRIYNFLPINIGALRTLSTFYDRFQLLAQIYLVLSAGMGIFFLVHYAWRPSARRAMLFPLYGLLVLSLITIALRTPRKVYLQPTGQLETLDTAAISPDAAGVWSWIAANVRPEKERIYIEDTYGRFAWNNAAAGPESTRSHLLALTSVFTDACQVGGWCGFTTRFARQYEQGTAFGRPVDSPDFSDSFVASTMKALNCRYVIAHSDGLVKRLGKMEFLEEAAVSGIFHVFAYPAMKPAWAYNTATGTKAEFIAHSQTYFELVADGRRGDEIHIARAYQPNYIASHNQSPLRVMNSASLLRITLPADGIQSIHFHYRINKKPALYGFITGILLLIGVIIPLPFFFSGKAINEGDCM